MEFYSVETTRRDNHKNLLRRDVSRDGRGILLRRDTRRDNRKNLLRRDVSRDGCGILLVEIQVETIVRIYFVET